MSKPTVPANPPMGYAQQIVAEYFAPAYEALDQRNRELWAARKTDEERRAEHQAWMQKRRDDVNARNTVLDARLAALPDILQPIIALHHRDEDGDWSRLDGGDLDGWTWHEPERIKDWTLMTVVEAQA